MKGSAYHHLCFIPLYSWASDRAPRLVYINPGPEPAPARMYVAMRVGDATSHTPRIFLLGGSYLSIRGGSLPPWLPLSPLSEFTGPLMQSWSPLRSLCPPEPFARRSLDPFSVALEPTPALPVASLPGHPWGWSPSALSFPFPWALRHVSACPGGSSSFLLLSLFSF